MDKAVYGVNPEKTCKLPPERSVLDCRANDCFGQKMLDKSK